MLINFISIFIFSLGPSPPPGSIEKLFDLVETGNDAGLTQLLETYDCLSIVNGDTDVFEKSPLYRASEYDHDNVVQVLLDHGADIETSNWHGYTALHVTSLGGYKFVVQLLLDHGADIEAVNNYGNTPLHISILSSKFDIGIIKTLLDYGADINARNKMSKTLLHIVIQY